MKHDEETGSGEGRGGGAPPRLTEQERKDVEERSAPRTEVVYEAIREEGENELRRSASALAWDGLAAGLSMGFSLAAEGLLRSHLPDAAWRPLVAKLGYTVGFLIIVMGRHQLFTENTLTVILPLLQKPTAKNFARVARLWGVVLVANLAGALAFAWVVGHTEIFRHETREAFAQIGREAMEGGHLAIFLRGLFAGWLIAMMVWMLPAAESARFFVVVVMTWLVAVSGLAHIVAGSIDVLYVVASGGAPWSVYFGWMIPALAGNIIGGTTLVAALGHAQVVNSSDEEA
ncbi:MAG: formate/nitrite transporter family protein [Acidobacteriota bacterium]|nr:formate/nitrite transporter family protein [Acidobacteriota bacterium]